MIPRRQLDKPVGTAIIQTRRAATSPEPGDTLQVTAVRDLRGAAGLRAEWSDLHRQSRTNNPFTHPAWMLTWARHFLRSEDVYIVTVRRAGRLIGLAPLCWVHTGGVAAALHLMGNPECAQLTEVPGILTVPGEHRTVLRRLLEHIEAERTPWDWLKLTLDAGQGWFEPQWLTKTTRWSSPVYLHQATRAFVLVDLPETWETFLSTRKRNVRESIRRSTNRLSRQGADWSVEVVTEPDELPGALDAVIDLHASRTEMPGKPYHPSMLERSDARAFYREAVAEMAAAGLAEVTVLRGKGESLGGLVVLRAGDGVFTSITGADPKAWTFGPGTILLAEMFRREIRRGTATVNLSGGPNQSKLRWSERMEYNHDFAVVGARPRSKVIFAAYTSARSLVELGQAMQWDIRRGSEAR